MNIHFRWLIGGVILVASFMAGRLSVESNDQTGHEPEGIDSETRSPSIVVGESAEKMRSSRRERAKHRSENRRATELKVLLAACNPVWQSVDPFEFLSIGESDVARLYAWIMQTKLSEYPEVMSLVERATFDDNGDQNVENLLLARWVELDPNGALQWATERESAKEDGDILQLHVNLAKESLPYHPKWAIEKMRIAALAMIEEYKKGKRSDDPFGVWNPYSGNNFDLDLDTFYQRIAILYPSECKIYKEKLGAVVFEHGQDGWYRGVAQALGKDAIGVIAEMAKDPETGLIESGAFSVIAEQDWKRARSWLEQHGGNYDLDSTVFHHARGEDFNQAAEWFLSRSADSSDRAERVDDVTRMVEERDNQVKWLRQMEADGQPVHRAWYNLVYRMISSGEVENALQYVSRVPAEGRDDLMKAIYRQASDRRYFSGRDGSVDFFTPKEKERAFIQSHPGYREYIRNANREALNQFKDLIKGVEIQLDGE